jgi:hypothetical protein
MVLYRMLISMSRNLMLIALFLAGTLFPLAGFPPPQSPPSPEATQAVSEDTIIFLPMTIRSPLVSPPTPTPPTPTTPPPTPTAPTPTLPPIGDAIVVDHTSLALFDQIPDQYLTAARSLPMMFSDRSVGYNINDALNCLAAPSWGESSAACRRDYLTPTTTDWKTYSTTDLANDAVPELIQFPASSTIYNRANWTYTDCADDWSAMTEYFINSLAPQYLPTKTVLSCQFSYLNVDDGSGIADPLTGYFANTSAYDVYDLEAFIAQHPDKEFIFWTTSLARSIGTREATEFNDQMRRYAIENDKILFDMADIISHDRFGNLCYDNINDGVNYPAICTDYTTELEGGHLGSVSGGKIVMAKAFWVLMAQIAGWNP